MLLRVAAVCIGLLLLASATAVAVEHAGQGGAHALLVWSLAGGTAVGAFVVARSSWRLGAVVFLAVLCGESYGMLATAERIIASREERQAPRRIATAQLRESNEAFEKAEVALSGFPPSAARLEVAKGGKERAEEALLAKAADRNCGTNCRQLLQSAVTTASEEIERARREIEVERARLERAVVEARARVAAIQIPAASGTALADRLGLAAWLLDVVAATLLTVGANGLAIVLIAWGAHSAVIEEKQVQDVVTEVIEATVADPRVGFRDFIEACIEPSGGAIAQEALERAYSEWCDERGLEKLKDTMLDEGIVSFCKACGIERGRYDGRVYLAGIGLRSIKRLSAGVGTEKSP